ncbi:MAG: RES family NAD+ phosphorylase [Thermoanaerobaculia bacterium]
MRVWRICRKPHAAFDGEGARLAGGRWNLKGSAVVYTSSSLSLAALEMLVHFDIGDAPDDLVSVWAELPAALQIKRLTPAELPRRWRDLPAPEELAIIGTDWVASGATAVLSVPSAIVEQEQNYLLNPYHEDFRRVSVGTAEAFRFDTRLLKRRSSRPKRK